MQGTVLLLVKDTKVNAGFSALTSSPSGEGKKKCTWMAVCAVCHKVCAMNSFYQK